MTANVINRADFGAAFRQLRRRPGWLLQRLAPGKQRKIIEAWSHAAGPPVHWFNVPEIVARRAERATGAVDVGVAEYVASRYLEHDAVGISLGCGTGDKEAAWASTGRFRSLTCYDIAESRIAVARERFGEPPLAFVAADAYTVEIPDESLDIVVFEDSLHHLEPVAVILERVRRWLKPGGLLVVNEFVGPRRFQWTERQLDAANAALRLLPERLRLSHAHGTVKRRIDRPSLLRMRLTDPSEAVESDRIMPCVRELFTIVEERQLGGTIVNLVVDDIAQHFLDDEDEWLPVLFALEDRLLDAGEIESDYVLTIARNGA